MRLAAAVFLLVAACIIALGAVWLNVAAPRLERLPAEFRREDTFSGTYRILDTATGEMSEVAVVVQQLRETVRNEDNVALVRERVVTMSPTGQPYSQFPPTETALLVDRTTRLYLAGSSEVRSGGMDFPPDVKAGQMYPIWVSTARRALPARYNGASDVDGLKVYRFVIDVPGSPLGVDPQTGRPRVVDVYVEYQVDPRSGQTVDMRSESTVSELGVGGEKVVWLVSDLKFTDETRADNLSDAKNARVKLMLLGSFVPWLVMGLGMLFGLYGIFVYAVFRWRRRHVS